MLAVAHPTTPTSTSPTPPATTTSASTSSSATMQRKVSGAPSVNFRPSVSSRGSGGSASIHFQHQIPPSKAASHHVNGHVSSSSSSSTLVSATAITTTTPASATPFRPATPPPPPPPDSHSQQPGPPPQPAFDIASYSSTDLLKLLASLLTQIAATNDSLSGSHSSSHASSSSSLHSTSPAHIHSPIWDTLTAASRTALSTPASTLTFHARNIPTITLESYFLRILKYCPTTNHVFLSLLVYFDRMAKLSLESTGRAFVIDSYNVHRLVIAGVTVASKFFSDVFYTNSRYAKVGGLPLPELNQLELQFLLLNDFRLVIKGEEMQRYAEQLILFSKSNTAEKEKDREGLKPKEGKETEVADTPASSIPPQRPLSQAPGMQRRDSQNSYSSFPPAPSSTPGPSTTISGSKSGHVRSGSGGQPGGPSVLPSQSSVAASPSSPLRTPSVPFLQPGFSAILAPPMVRKRSTTPPGSISFHQRASLSSLDATRKAVPFATPRRTPPMHITARNMANSRTYGGTLYSDDDEESDDYDESDDEEDRIRSPARRRRRHAISVSNDAEAETETETEGETTDGGSGSTTSDEPTVRPVGVGRRRSLSTSRSSFGDDVDEAPADSQGDMVLDGEGTPEVRRQHTPKGDVNMGSPQIICTKE